MTQRRKARQLAAASLERGEPLAWFDTLYSSADGDATTIPWADLSANPSLRAWIASSSETLLQDPALIVGCGLGDDAEYLQSVGFDCVGFDISDAAIAWCKRRFSESKVEYRVADLLKPPLEWKNRFGFVVEIYTLQVLPPELRPQAMAAMAQCVLPGGRMLVIARGREETDDPGGMPWPLCKRELAYLETCGLTQVRFEDFYDNEEPPVRRFRIEYSKPHKSP